MAFKVEGKRLIVSLELRTPDQIFDLRDPSPFREKDLDEDFSRYLNVAIDEADDVEEVILRLSIPSGTFSAPDTPASNSHFKPSDIEAAIRDYYEFEVRSVTAEVQSIFEEGRWSFLLGCVFLVLCQAVSYSLHYFEPNAESFLFHAVDQGVQIIGWVALWRPLELLLYAWWPHVQKRKLFAQLAKMKVELVPGA